VRLVRTLASWEAVVRIPESKNQFVNAVHGALELYDLPDLIVLAGADKVQRVTPIDARGEPVAGGE
jgi:hypothetical protein